MSSPPLPLQQARVRCVSGAPYLSAVLYALRPVERPGYGTLGVGEDLRLYYDSACLARWTVSELAWVLAHEVHHVLRGHHARFPADGGWDHARANIAGDCEINDEPILPGSAPPQGVLSPSQYGLPDGESAEYYYAHLPESARPSPAAGPGQGACGGCAGNPGPGEPAPGDGDPGEGAGEGDPGDTPGASATAVAIARREVAQVIRDTVRSGGRDAGTIPGSLRAWAEATLAPPTISWRDRLRAIVGQGIARAAGRGDATYRRPSRRRIPGVILPGIRRRDPRIAVVLDTSGSMGSGEGSPLVRAGAEVVGIARAAGTGVAVYACDTVACAAVQVRSARDLARLQVGSGGTDLPVGIRAAIAPAPDVIICVTDGYTPWPSRADVGRAVLIACVVGGSRAEIPSWIQVVEVML